VGILRTLLSTCDDAKFVAVNADAVPSLVKLLSSTNVVLLKNACDTLKDICSLLARARTIAINRGASLALTPLLSHDDDEVKKAASEALQKFK
jgi:hypothetical protein